MVVCREDVGWQVEGIFNFNKNLASFLPTSESRRWYAIRAYVPPNDAPYVHRIKQALDEAPKGMDIILLGDLNIRLRELRDSREYELATVLADSRMGDMTAHFMSRWRYRGTESWMWQMRREGRQVTGRGDYIIITDRDNVVNAREIEARLHTYHQMVLAVI